MASGWERDDLLEILERDFINDPKAFTVGRRNDDCVDAMCICHALGDKWFYEDVWTPHAKKHGKDEHEYKAHVLPHVLRIDKWLGDKSSAGYARGDFDIMDYAINY